MMTAIQQLRELNPEYDIVEFDEYVSVTARWDDGDEHEPTLNLPDNMYVTEKIYGNMITHHVVQWHVAVSNVQGIVAATEGFMQHYNGVWHSNGKHLIILLETDDDIGCAHFVAMNGGIKVEPPNFTGSSWPVFVPNATMKNVMEVLGLD